LDGREELTVLPRHFPRREREDGDLWSGKENVTNDDESGESMLALVFAGKGSPVSGIRGQGESGAHPKPIQVCLVLERPQLGHIVRQLELLAWPPAFDKATYIRRDDGVGPVAVLLQGVRLQPSEP